MAAAGGSLKRPAVSTVTAAKRPKLSLRRNRTDGQTTSQGTQNTVVIRPGGTEPSDTGGRELGDTGGREPGVTGGREPDDTAKSGRMEPGDTAKSGRMEPDDTDPACCHGDKPGELFFCPVCSKNLSKFSPEWRGEHLTRCSEESEKKEGERIKSSDQKPVEACILCDATFKTEQARVTHLKACASKRGVATNQLLEMMRNHRLGGNVRTLLKQKQPGSKVTRPPKAPPTGHASQQKVLFNDDDDFKATPILPSRARAKRRRGNKLAEKYVIFIT